MKSFGLCVLNLLQAAGDAAFVVSDSSPRSAKLRTLGQFARLFLAPRGAAHQPRTVGRRRFRVHYLDFDSFFYLYREIFIRQCYLFRPAMTAPVIFDCGANIGMATLYFKDLFPQSVIYAFEPDSAAFDCLQTNVAGNHLENVHLHNCALWDRDGEIEFHKDANTPGSLKMSVIEERQPGPKVVVPCARLSSFFPDTGVDFLKLDVEGAEFRILAELASNGSLARVRQMAVECHHAIPGQAHALGATLDLLQGHGFSWRINAAYARGRPSEPVQDIVVYAFRETSESAAR